MQIQDSQIRQVAQMLKLACLSQTPHATKANAMTDDVQTPPQYYHRPFFARYTLPNVGVKLLVILRANVPPMKLVDKSRTFSQVQLRRGSSVPVISQRGITLIHFTAISRAGYINKGDLA
jgi:hypothetical protein